MQIAEVDLERPDPAGGDDGLDAAQVVGVAAARGIGRADGVQAGDEPGDGQRAVHAERVVEGGEAAAHRQGVRRAGRAHLLPQGGGRHRRAGVQQGTQRTHSRQVRRYDVEVGVDHARSPSGRG